MMFCSVGERAWHRGGAGAADVATSVRAEDNKEATDAVHKDHAEQEVITIHIMRTVVGPIIRIPNRS